MSDSTKIGDLSDGGSVWRNMDGSVELHHCSGSVVILDREMLASLAREWMDQSGIQYHLATIKAST